MVILKKQDFTRLSPFYTDVQRLSLASSSLLMVPLPTEKNMYHIICPDGEVQDGSRLGMGTIGKKCHTTLQTPIPRKRNSSVGVVGIISPAQVCPSLLPVVSQGFTSFIESNYSLHILQLENLLSYLEKGRLDTKTAISRARLAHMDVIEVYLAS